MENLTDVNETVIWTISDDFEKLSDDILRPI